MTRLYVDGPTLIRAVEAATRNLEKVFIAGNEVR
jgi:hypothetical protein